LVAITKILGFKIIKQATDVAADTIVEQFHETFDLMVKNKTFKETKNLIILSRFIVLDTRAGCST